MDIVWTSETVAKLFEVGPAAYTLGTKMPEQRIGNAADRQAGEVLGAGNEKAKLKAA
jgi:cytochrome c